MLKKLIKDEQGSAFVLAILVMIVAVILAGSFTNNVSTATKLEANATKVDESYLIAKSGMLYFEQMVKLNNWDKSTVLTKFANPVKGTIEGQPNTTYFDIEVTDRTAANEYNIICTGHFGGASYKLYKYALAGGGTTPNPTPTNSSPRTDLLDYANGDSWKKTLSNGFEGSYYILNDEPGGWLEITDTDSSGHSFGKLVTVTSVDLNTTAQGYLIGSNNGDDGIITKGIFRYSGPNITVPGKIYCNSFEGDNDGKNITISGNLHVATDMVDKSQMDGYRRIEGEVMVAGDCELYIQSNSKYDSEGNLVDTYYIEDNLIVGGDLKIHFGGDGTLNVNNIYVKGNILIDGGKSGSIKIRGNTSKTVYIKNGNLVNGGCDINAVGTSAGGDALALDTYFASDTDVPDYVCYKKIIKEINAEFPNTSKPETQLPASVTDAVLASSDPSPTKIISGLGSLTKETITDYEGEKNLYRIKQDAIITCPLNDLIGDRNNILLIEASEEHAPRDADGNPTSSDEAIDIRFTNNFYLGQDARADLGGKILINDNNHAGCIRFFLDPGIALTTESAGHWPIEAINTPPDTIPTSGTAALAKQFVSVSYDADQDGTVDSKLVNYDYVPNLYVFSLATDSNKASTSSLVSDDAGGPVACIPAYILTPNTDYFFGGTTAGYTSGSGPVTWDNAPKVHGCLNSNDATAQNGKQVFVKGNDPDALDGYTGGQQKWKYDDAIYGVYGYFDGGEYSS